MNIKRLLRDASQVSYASARVFSDAGQANQFLASNKDYKVVPNAQGVPSTSITVALTNDEGVE